MTLGGFDTDRLHVRDWADMLGDPVARRALEEQLKTLLTGPVLRHLPPALQLSDAAGAVSDWIAARASESTVCLVSERDGGGVVGLLILADTGAGATRREWHIGYLLAEPAWGRGYASELVRGLVSAAEQTGPCLLAGGVAGDNPASARVLEKAGFRRDPALSAPGTDVYTREIA